MTTGVDSYVSLAEADAYVAVAYADSDVASAWALLEDDQREFRLVTASIALDALPFPGRKRNPRQALQFPRWPLDDVPVAIQHAQMEIALATLKPEYQTLQADIATRATLQRSGVTAFSIGDLSESYGGAGNLVSEHAFLADATIHQLLAPFLRGGFAVC